jgi:hypothetical protein
VIPPRTAIRFDRNEFSGAFGDIGTDLPLIVLMIATAKIDPAGALITFGSCQVFSAIFYGIPMPVQPLKAVAVLTILAGGKIGGPVIWGAGLAIGAVMLLLTLTGMIDLLARIIPRAVIRGIQFGLGAKLAIMALRDHIPRDGAAGYFLAAGCAVITICLLGNRRFPPALLVIALGAVYAALFRLKPGFLTSSFGFRLPQVQAPSWGNIWQGFLILALPQIPLSLGNSIFATRQLAEDYFPEKRISARQIGLTYSLINLVAPFFGGIPACHGSGGMAGHHAFGGRTGGSAIIYGALFLGLGLFFSNGFQEVIKIFPYPVLGTILLFEALALMRLVSDTVDDRGQFPIALLVGVLAVGLPYGFLIGMIAGTLVYYASRKIDLGLTRD